MSFKFERKKHQSVNDGAMKSLPGGEHNYRIVEASYEPVKSDKTKKRKHIKFGFRHSDGQIYSYFLELGSRPIPSTATDKKSAREKEVTRQKIAAEVMAAILDACGWNPEAVFTPAKLKTLINKDVGIRCEVSKGTGTTSYTNIREIVEPYETDEGEDLDEEEEEEDLEDEDDIPMDHDEEEDEEEEDLDEEDEEEDDEEEEEEPAPKPKRKLASKKATTKKSTRRKPEPEPEEEDEEDEEEDDEPF